MAPSLTAIQRFEQWFLSNGGQFHCNASLVEADDGRYNVRVNDDAEIEDDAIIVSCPTNLAFSFMTYAEDDKAGHISNIDKTSLTQTIVVRLNLMEQYLLGEDSFWWPYISTLPQPYLSPVFPESKIAGVPSNSSRKPFHTPLYFDEEDLLWLEGTNLGAAAGSRASTWREEFEDAKDSMKGLDESKHALWTSDLYIWAATVFTTRSFSASALRIPGLNSAVLIPGVDLLNHSPQAKVTWNWGSPTCSVRTNQKLYGGNEVFNNYGAKGNEELLMGYGFCLESNQADSFNLSYAPELSQHIKAAKARRATAGPNGTSVEAESRSTTIMETDTLTSKDETDGVVEDVKFVSIRDGDYHFSPGFLADCSLALQNRRERQQDSVCSPNITRFSNDTLSRNKLHTISSIMMILQQKQMDIRKHDSSLPLSPNNQNQTYASIYRSSQLKILEVVLQQLSLTTQSITQLRFETLPRICHLVDILEGVPKSLKRHLREVINAGVRTREASKIAERGGVKFAFAMWLCGLRLLHSSGDLVKQDPALSNWIDFLLRHYKPSPADECSDEGQVDDGSLSKAEEMAATVRSYANAIRIAVGRHPGSLYGGDWAQNQENLAWCVAVVKEEGVRCPTVTETGILGEKHDDFVVVVDAESMK